MHTFYTPNEKTVSLIKSVHADREIGMQWKPICKKYKKSRSYLAPLHSWYVKTQLEGGKQS